MMQDLKRYFQYLDGVAEETEPAYVTTRRGPMFYNIPTATKLTAMFGLEPGEAFRVLRAWQATLDPTKTLNERVSRAERVCCYPPIYW